MIKHVTIETQIYQADYAYDINECFDLLWDYYEDHKNEMSDFEQDAFEDAIDIGFDMRKVIESIYEGN